MKLTKRERFNKIAPKRVQSTLKAIRLLKNVSNTSNYEYTENEANQIIRARKTMSLSFINSFSQIEFNEIIDADRNFPRHWVVSKGWYRTGCD